MTALEVAATQIGTTEYPPNSNKVKYNTWYYGSAVSGAEYPWCVCFQQWCAAEAGSPLPYKTASCTALLNWYRANDPGCIVKTPKAGDLGIMSFSKGSYHIGIVEGVGGNNIITIEGNTSSNGSQDNGGAVLRKTRSLSNFVAFIRPRVTVTPSGGGNNTLDIVKGSTDSEKAMVKAIQSAVGANADGEIGTQTMTDIACLLNANCFPLTVKLYGAPTIIAKDIIPFSAGGAKLSDYTNTINGSFYGTDKKTGISRPCSILVQDGVVVQGEACHAAYDKPESVLYRTWSGETGILRATNASQLPKGLSWAVGGVGLLNNYNPGYEGFGICVKNGKTENFSDVIQKNNHTMLGIKNGYCYLVYCASMTGDEVNSFAKKLGFYIAIMLDGGHVAGINGAESFAKINTSTKQYYMIQGIGEKVR